MMGVIVRDLVLGREFMKGPDNYYLEQEIEQKNIDHNMELAMEASPESFGTVIMLYINCKVSYLMIQIMCPDTLIP